MSLLITALFTLMTFVVAPPAHAVDCGVGARVPWESLCNVESDLVAPYLWIERTGHRVEFFRDRLSGIVRDRHVTIEWDWWGLLPGPHTLGAYIPRADMVVIPRSLRREPHRVQAAVMAHEIAHAYQRLRRIYPATFWGCIREEESAFKLGVVFWSNAWVEGERSGPFTELDYQLYQHVVNANAYGLDAVADRHSDGYVAYCSQYPNV